MDHGSLEDLFDFVKKKDVAISEAVLCALTYQVTAVLPRLPCALGSLFSVALSVALSSFVSLLP
jgi:hypothetical protein